MVSPDGRQSAMSRRSTRPFGSPIKLSQLVLILGLLAGTLAPGGVAGATPKATTPVAAPPEQVLPDSSSASQAKSKLEEARAHASADVHAAAIEAYLDAFRLDPSLIPLYADELGHQYNWNDQAPLAIPWFEQRLAVSPGNVPSRIGYARALSWSGRTYEGWQEYRRVLVGHPRVLEARLGEAQTLGWLGRNREAARRYQGILDDHPDNHAARLGMAQNWAWAGELQLAMDALDPLRGDPEAEALRESILAAQRPEIIASSRFSHDSDTLDILDNGLAVESSTPRWQDFHLGARQLRFQQDNQPDIDAWGLKGGGGLRPSVATQLHAYLSFLQFSSNDPISGGPPEKVDWLLVGWDAWFTWFHGDRWRFDLSTDRTFVDTPRSISEHIAIASGSGSFDARLQENLRWNAIARYSRYSDDNGRILGTTGLTYSRGHRWRWSLIPSATTFSFSKQSNKGYWNPPDFFNGTLSGAVEGEFSESVSLQLEGGVGHEWADDDDYGVLHGSAQLDWRISRHWRLELSGGSSDSALSSSGGYTRSWAAAVLRYRF